MREPNEIRKSVWNDRNIDILIYLAPTDVPSKSENSSWEGWDIAVEVEMVVGDHLFMGYSGLGAVWGPTNEIRKIINSHIDDEIIPEAINDMRKNIIDVANGVDIEKINDLLLEAENKKGVAKWLQHKFIIG